MARRYVNPVRDSRLRAGERIRSAAEMQALMAADPGPWTLIKTADLETLLGQSAEVDWGAVADSLRGGLR